MDIRALIYVPESRPGMFETSREGEAGVALYCRKVMIKAKADNLLPKCDANDPEGSGCDDQEIAYVAKMRAKDADAITKELARLEGMKGSAMKPDKKAWLGKRVHILKALST